MKNLKRSYKEKFEKFRELKDTLEETERALEKNRADLIASFEVWYQSTWEKQAEENKLNISQTLNLNHTKNPQSNWNGLHLEGEILENEEDLSHVTEVNNRIIIQI
jgi:hypothetical protein